MTGSCLEEKAGGALCFREESVEGDACGHDCDARVVQKKDGRVIQLAEVCLLKAIAGQAIVLDVRDPNEVVANKGGVTVDNAVHVPLNIDGLPQSQRSTTLDEFKTKLQDKGLLTKEYESHPFIVHCTGGGRASKAVQYLEQLGMEAYNGGDPNAVREAIAVMQAKQQQNILKY